MKRFGRTFLGLILLIGCAQTQAIASNSPTVQTISLDSCRQWARDNYPAIQEYQLIKESAEYSVSNAARAWIPRVTLTAQAIYQSEAADMSQVWSEMGLDAMLQQLGKEMPELRMQQLQGKVQLDVQQTIWDGGASRASKEIAQASAAADIAALEVDLDKLEDRIENLYFGILLLDEQIVQMQSLIELLQANLARVRTSYDAQAALQSDVFAVEVEELSAQQKLNDLRHSSMAYRQMLSLLIGKNISKSELTRPLGNQAMKQSGNQAIPEVRLLDAQSSLLQAKEKQLWASTMPQFTAFAQGWYGYPTLNMFEAMQSSKWGLSAIVGVTMRWNISNFYTLNNQRKQLQLRREQLQLKKNVIERGEDLNDIQTNNEIMRLTTAVENDKKIVQLRTAVRQTAEVSYENQTITTSELLKAIHDEMQAKSTMAIHEVQLMQAMGGL